MGSSNICGMFPESGWSGHPRDDCYLCNDECDVLERHHIHPRRHGGGDEARNLVTVCPTCHKKLERLYDRRFYQGIGVRDPPEQDDEVEEPEPEGLEAKLVYQIVHDFEIRYYNPVGAERLFELCQRQGLSSEEIDSQMDTLRSEGMIYEPKANKYSAL